MTQTSGRVANALKIDQPPDCGRHKLKCVGKTPSFEYIFHQSLVRRKRSKIRKKPSRMRVRPSVRRSNVM